MNDTYINRFIPNNNKSIHKNLSTETTMKTKLSSVLCVVLISWPWIGSSQSFTTFGTPDCGEWIKQNSVRDKSWLLGYLSGINSEPLNQKYDALNELNSAQQAGIPPI